MLGLALAGLLAGCVSLPGSGRRFERFASPPAADGAGYCAWYGDSDGEALYFGESAFWASMRAAKGEPTADLGVSGNKRIGRFDAATGAMSAPLQVDVPGGSGIWDVLALENGVYFTTFFGPAGFVEPSSGALTVFESLGPGLNELARGPDGNLLASRYGSAGGGPGSVVVLRPDGSLVAEHLLAAPAGYLAAPKTVAWDPLRREVWVTVDLVSTDGGPARQDMRRLAADGRELARVEDPEIQFVVFVDGGTGYLAARYGRRLELLVVEPAASGDPLAAARRIVLDDQFDPSFDFVQDIHAARDGRLVMTRWSGKIHVVEPRSGRFETIEFPRDGAGGLYYSGVLLGGRLCATYCAGVEVICTEAP